MKLELVLIPAGKFTMGSPEGEKDRDNDETEHEVTITRHFYMGKYEVTVAQFEQFVTATGYKTDADKAGWAYVWTGKAWGKVPDAKWRKPGFKQGADHPVCAVSWNDAKAFCEWLARKTGRSVRLPTESEWEYAARAGTRTAYPWGDCPDAGKGWENVADQSFKRRFTGWRTFSWDDGYVFTAPAGKFKANGFGLHDTVGNVGEWCEDWYGEYPKEAVVDPQGAAQGVSRVLRGGSWFNYPRACRSANRNRSGPGDRYDIFGFRVVVVVSR
ncbi:MAG: formylglycine-generating enzyme family protein [Planctomycetota bacterium]|nr:formylglycine-generating enzyme family protein [Planctomycetota bacterium]